MNKGAAAFLVGNGDNADKCGTRVLLGDRPAPVSLPLRVHELAILGGLVLALQVAAADNLHFHPGRRRYIVRIDGLTMVFSRCAGQLGASSDIDDCDIELDRRIDGQGCERSVGQYAAIKPTVGSHSLRTLKLLVRGGGRLGRGIGGGDDRYGRSGTRGRASTAATCWRLSAPMEIAAIIVIRRCDPRARAPPGRPSLGPDCVTCPACWRATFLVVPLGLGAIPGATQMNRLQRLWTCTDNQVEGRSKPQLTVSSERSWTTIRESTDQRVPGPTTALERRGSRV